MGWSFLRCHYSAGQVVIEALPADDRTPPLDRRRLWLHSIGALVSLIAVWSALLGLLHAVSGCSAIAGKALRGVGAWLFLAFFWGTRTCSAFQVPPLGPHMRTEPPPPAPASCVDSDMPASVPAVDTGHYQAVCSRPVPTPCRNFRMPDCPWPLLADDDSEAGDDDHDLDFAVLAGPGEAPTLGLGGISAVVFRTLLCEAVIVILAARLWL